MMASLLMAWRTVSSSSCCENTGIGCQLYLLFHSMDVPFGGKKLAKTVCMDMCVRGTPVACACTNCLWEKQTERERGREGEGQEKNEQKSEKEIEWWGRSAWALQFVNVRTIRHPSVCPGRERERVSGGSLALGYLHRDCSRVPEICHNAYAANYQCWTARVCHSERWFIARRGRMARETTAGASTK